MITREEDTAEERRLGENPTDLLVTHTKFHSITARDWETFPPHSFLFSNTGSRSELK